MSDSKSAKDFSFAGSILSHENDLVIAREQILNTTASAMMVLTIFPLIFAYIRASEISHFIACAVQTVAWLLMALVAFTNKRLSFGTRVAITLLAWFIVSTAGLVTWGLLGFGIPFYMVFGLLAGLFLGFKRGLLLFGLAFIAMVAITAGVTQGFIVTHVDYNTSALQLKNWVVIVSCGSVMTVVLLIGFGKLFGILENQNRELEKHRENLDGIVKDRTSELHFSNKNLKEEIEHRKRAEEELNLTLDAATEGIWKWNFKTEEMFFSNNYYRMLGYEPNEFPATYESWIEQIHPDDRADTLQIIEEYVKTTPRNYENNFRMRTKTGEYRHIRSTAKIVERDADGNAVRMIGSHIDVTEQNKIHDKAIKSEKNFRDLLHRSPFPIAVADSKDEEIYFWSQSATELFGHTPSSVKEWNELAFPDLAYRTDVINGWNPCIETALREKKIVNTGEYTITCKDGTTRTCEIYVYFIDKYLIITFKDITDRKQAEKTLRDSEERFQQAMQATSDGLYDWNLATNEIYYSPTWKSMLGYEDHELPNEISEWERLTNPEDVKKSWEILKDHFEGRRDRFELEFKMKHKDGHWVDILSRANAIFDENGKPVRVIGTHINITKRKIAEESLRKSETFLAKSQAIAHVGSWHLDLIENKLFWSDENYRIFGFKPGEVDATFETFISCVHPDDRDYVNETYTKAIETNTPYECTHRILRRDGTIRIVHEVSEELRDSHGKAVASLGMTIDITKQKKDQLELEARAALLREAQKIANVGSWSFNPETQTPLWSEQMFHIFGLDPEQGVPDYESHKKLIHPDDWERFDSAVANAVEKGIGYNLELRIILKDKSIRYINTICEPQTNDNGKVIGLVGAIKDLTEQKAFEEARIKTVEHEKMAAIGRVAGKMAHDMNNVLSVTMSLSELILHTHELPPNLRADIETIRESAERGAEITQNLLFFAKDQEAKFTQFNLNEKISGVLRGLHKELEGIQTITNFSHGTSKIIADVGMVENALLNLLHNSIHAMSKTEKPQLIIRTYTNHEHIKITIEDNGCGIPEDQLKNVFDVSFSLKGSRDNAGYYSRDIKGSGYGLANVKKSIDKHGGTITIESKERQGTTVIVTLPLIDENINEEEIKRIHVNDSVKGKRILVVEDEQHIGNIQYKLLRMYDHSVNKASNGYEALDLFSNNEYDAISLDFLLPDMNGMEVYKKIRETNKDVPIIFVSGNFEFMQSMVDLKNNDSNVDHLAKPFNNVAYLTMIHKWL